MEELCKLWDVVQTSLVDALPGQPTTPTDLASHLYQHSQIPIPPRVSGKPHKQMLVTPLSNKCTLHTSRPFLFHPCPLSSPPSCGNPAHDCRFSRRFSVWSFRSVSVSLSGSSIPRNHREAATQEDDGAATTRYKSATVRSGYGYSILHMRTAISHTQSTERGFTLCLWWGIGKL